MRKTQTIICMLLACMSVLSLSAHALTLRLSERDVNQMVTMAFPQKQYYNGVELTFTNPHLTFGASDNDVAVTVTMRAEQGGQFLTAEGSFAGRLTYIGARKELQIERPMMTDFTVLEDNLDNSAPVIDAIKSATNKTVPVILLVDFRELNLSFFANQAPRSIEIVNRQLVVEI
ncbi:hypothetical protein CA267_010520 [Alteromonas pelagimontana]|uniref:DUF1439 domain-containing protein n=1 Tax=Alteromonas pelagimontana TaxID=1858656 RepID=A0A6M4MDK1_9ALTE|nr:hypothetical protein [Alteromonas pelagimontana]QJR81182.1 hypothetical protein CA267_010520 [Alteromonas pelagimontana]